MSDADNSQAASVGSDNRTPAVVAVFMNPQTLVQHYKTVADAINGNSRIQGLANETNTVCIVSKKSGLSRQLMMGPLDAYPMEYSHTDWLTSTQGHKHLPDLVLQRKPGLLIVISSDAQLLFNVVKTVYQVAKQPITKEESQNFVDWAKEIRAGDVYQFHRQHLAAAEFDAAFEILFELNSGDK